MLSAGNHKTWEVPSPRVEGTFGPILIQEIVHRRHGRGFATGSQLKTRFHMEETRVHQRRGTKVGMSEEDSSHFLCDRQYSRTGSSRT